MPRTLLTGRPGAGGWAQKHKWVRVAKTIETPRGWNGRHAGQGRVRPCSVARVVGGWVLSGESDNCEWLCKLA